MMSLVLPIFADLPDEVLVQQAFTRVVRRRRPDGTVILKELLGGDRLQRRRHEARILERLAGVEGVSRLANYNTPDNAIALEDVGARTLAQAFPNRAMELPDLLLFARKMAGILAAVHRRGVVHKEITPENIVLAADDTPVLIDFSLATTAAEERPAFVHQNEIAGTLAYLAPEQTGRTGQALDHRADLYGLGAVLYEMATGHLPFEENDPLQLIHDILAQAPRPPVEFGVPTHLSDIILRLLEKEPGRRYQSAEGLAYDLNQVSGRSRPGSEIFVLGERDFPLRLTAPSQPIGRDKEVKSLQIAFDRAISGGKRGVFVTGDPGVGKSTLINALRPIVTARRGCFVAGKFDQYRQDLPTDAVHQAFRALGRMLLAEPETELATLRVHIRNVLGANAGLMAAMLPELAILLDIPPERGIENLDANKAEGRLIQAAVGLLRAVASPSRPLVMVVDDIQWAASTPVEFVDAVLMDESLNSVLLVAAYRDREVAATHPLSAMLSRWERSGAASAPLRLKNLQPQDLRTLVQEVLRLPPNEAEELTNVIAPRTSGNPYDTLVMLNELKRDGLLTPNDQGWNWDRTAIRQYVGEGDVVRLLSSRIDQLPRGAGALLDVIACLGGEVEMDLLKSASDLSLVELEERLAPSLEDGLIVLDRSGDDRIRFRHDRVQQATYDRMTQKTRRSLHLTLARRLSDAKRFVGVAAEQYLPAFEEVRELEERRRAALIFLQAALNLRLVNYAVAERFLSAGISLLNTSGAGSDTELLGALEVARHEALYNLGRLTEGDELYDSIERRAGDPMTLVDAACVQVSSLTNRSRPREAIALGLDVLRRLGVAVPSEEKMAAETESGLDLFYDWVNSDHDDLTRPEIRSPRIRGIARILDRMMPAAYFCDLATMTWLAAEALRIWTSHGPCPALIGPLGHASLAIIATRSNYDIAYHANRRVLEMSERRGYEPETSQSRFLFAVTAQSWFEPLEDNARDAQRAREGLLRGGDVIQACHTYYASTVAFLESSQLLETFAAEAESAIGFAERLGNEHAANSFLVYRQLVRALRGETSSVAGFSDSAFSEADHLAKLGDNHLAIFVFHVYRALAALLFGDTPAVTLHARAAEPHAPYNVGLYTSVLFRLTRGVALAQRVRNATVDEQPHLLGELNADLEWMGSRAADAPGNFLHFARLIEAERAWATDDALSAAHAFEDALSAVEQRRRPWHKALITERAAQFHLSTGLTHTGRFLLAEAAHLYEEWGGEGKVRELKREHPWLGSLRRESSPARANTVSADSIDLHAIIRASQSLSSETSLSRLRTQVVEVLGAITGATDVLLVLRDDATSGWMLSLDQQSAAISVEEAGMRGMLPLSAFRYAERTREPLMVADIVRDDRFAQDPWAAGLECCSILLVPILNHGVPRAILVLENRLSRDVFSADRLEAVKLIAGQLAVSLDNAMLYASMERKVAERTEALEQSHRQLLDVSRQAGMAEVATNVLHNVGNVLNSVNISCSVISDAVREMRIGAIAKIGELLKENAGDLAGFLNTQKGRQLPLFFDQLGQHLSANQRSILNEIRSLSQNIDHINGIVAMQQGYAKVNGVRETIRMEELLEDALRLDAGSFERHGIEVVRDFRDAPPISVEKHKVLQILVNLINNAKDAILEHNTVQSGRLVLQVSACEQKVRVQIKDNGIGIAPNDLPRIFAHGFTKKKDGHGFGLHSGVLAAREMGGDLIAESEGTGKGATFTLLLPTEALCADRVTSNRF